MVLHVHRLETAVFLTNPLAALFLGTMWKKTKAIVQIQLLIS